MSLPNQSGNAFAMFSFKGKAIQPLSTRRSGSDSPACLASSSHAPPGPSHSDQQGELPFSFLPLCLGPFAVSPSSIDVPFVAPLPVNTAQMLAEFLPETTPEDLLLMETTELISSRPPHPVMSVEALQRMYPSHPQLPRPSNGPLLHDTHPEIPNNFDCSLLPIPLQHRASLPFQPSHTSNSSSIATLSAVPPSQTILNASPHQANSTSSTPPSAPVSSHSFVSSHEKLNGGLATQSSSKKMGSHSSKPRKPKSPETRRAARFTSAVNVDIEPTQPTESVSNFFDHIEALEAAEMPETARSPVPLVTDHTTLLPFTGTSDAINRLTEFQKLAMSIQEPTDDHYGVGYDDKQFELISHATWNRSCRLYHSLQQKTQRFVSNTRKNRYAPTVHRAELLLIHRLEIADATKELEDQKKAWAISPVKQKAVALEGPKKLPWCSGPTSSKPSFCAIGLYFDPSTIPPWSPIASVPSKDLRLPPLAHIEALPKPTPRRNWLLTGLDPYPAPFLSDAARKSTETDVVPVNV